jgi:hypothetical protein
VPGASLVVFVDDNQVLVQPAAHVRPVDEVQVQQVVGQSDSGRDAILIGGFVPGRLPVEADEATAAPVAESLEEAGKVL